MVGKGIVFLQRFASRVTIGSRADYSRENNPRAGGTVRHFAEELDGLCIHTHNIACPFAAGAPCRGAKLDRQPVSNCYVRITLINLPKDIASRFVFEQFEGFEVSDGVLELINDPRLDTAVSECNCHRDSSPLLRAWTRFSSSYAKLAYTSPFQT